VGGVFRGDAQEGRQEAGPDALQPDEAGPGHAGPADQLGPERGREEAGQDGGVHPEVDQDAAVDDAAEDRGLHGCLLERLTANGGFG
jgi:hypothetical protein